MHTPRDRRHPNPTTAERVEALQTKLSALLRQWIRTELPQWVLPPLDGPGLHRVASLVAARLRELDPSLEEVGDLYWDVGAGLDDAGRLDLETRVMIFGTPEELKS